LVAAESRGYRDRGCRGAANIAAMAYSLCRIVLHHHSIRQFGLSLNALLYAR